MAMFVHQNSKGLGARHRRRPMSDINVTPMVDVMLVLLVIFMVTAPLLTTGVNVDLPAGGRNQLSEPDNRALTISVRADGSVYLMENAVGDLTQLAARLRAIKDVNQDSRIYVRGDTTIDYGRVMEVLGTLHAAGYTKAALVTKPH
jgi:biopolymer transport protein TolR